jgi:hypothetical protein
LSFNPGGTGAIGSPALRAGSSLKSAIWLIF